MFLLSLSLSFSLSPSLCLKALHSVRFLPFTSLIYPFFILSSARLPLNLISSSLPGSYSLSPAESEPHTPLARLGTPL